jgi:tetratricopeptide (TPR) repeat protein
MPASDPLQNIYYVSIEQVSTREIGGFAIDPSIRLPVELTSPGAFRSDSISWEAIISAMLKLLAYRPEDPQADYYRRFVLAVNPGIKEEFTSAGIIKIKQDQPEMAIEIFRALAGLFPECPSTRNNLALSYEERARQHLQRGEEQLAEHNSELAFESYKQALSLDPELAATHLNFGYFYLRRHNFDKAKQHFDAYLRHNRDPRMRTEALRISQELANLQSVEKTCARAYDAIETGREREAVAMLQGLLEKWPELWNAWFLLGWAHRRLAEYEEGRLALEKARRLNNRHADTLNELAICLMELEQLEESRGLLLEALKLEPENITLLSNLGILAIRMNRSTEAKGYFRRVSALSPQDPLASRYLHYLAEGR